MLVCFNIESVETEAENMQAHRTTIPLHMVVVFSVFQDDVSPLTQTPAWADSIFDGLPGSVSYYFDEISFGEYTITGEYLPKVYTLPHAADFYVDAKETYARDLLDLLNNDPAMDFSRYDNDGMDGVPGSGDDDGYVDYLVMMPYSRPVGFIEEHATGIAVIPITEDYTTNDVNSEGRSILIGRNSGCIATAGNLVMAVGTICHEYIHTFGARDLYDTDYKLDQDFEIDSAGIGNWGVMSRGLLGWGGSNGPVGPSAVTRIKMRLVGKNNSNLIDVYGMHHGLRIKDAGLSDGAVYRIWVTNREYFLVEYRRNDNLYCERNNPANGMLIWHVNELGNNDNEQNKYVDLECPDGRFLDAGYPLGIEPNPLEGGDNLDFWAHNQEYADARAGNLGDATDVYDGVTYIRFSPDTNPNSHATNGTYTGIEIDNIRTEGDEMVFDVCAPPFAGWLSAIPPIGIADQRFRQEQVDVSAGEINTLYLLDTGGGNNDDLLLSVFNNSLKVDEISSLDEAAVQRLIEARIAEDEAMNLNARITRSNCSTDDLEDVLELFNAVFSDISGEPVRKVQNLTLELNLELTPEPFSLRQNYPNPFNGTTIIPFTLSEPEWVVIEVYNILGQKVWIVDCGFLEAGQHTVTFKPTGFASGVYL
ncbi:T9SS type A sorting domain-containing protein [Candidatus Latescibacterota bacterium]